MPRVEKPARPTRECRHVIVTVRSAAQAEAYAYQAELLRSRGAIPEDLRIDFAPDPEAGPAGSGGALLLGIERLVALLAADGASLTTTRALIIHAGGEGRRVPCTMGVGKLMMSIPVLDESGRSLTIFEHVLATLLPVFRRLPPGLLTIGGDCLVSWDTERPLALPRQEVVALSARRAYETVRNHAIYVPDDSHTRVRRILQKSTPEEAHGAGAVVDGDAYYDFAGLLFFRPAALSRLARLLAAPCGGETLRAMLGRGLMLDQWTDLTFPLALDTTEAAFRSGVEGLRGEARGALWSVLSGCGLGFVDVGEHSFRHLGTLVETAEAFPSPDGPVGVLNSVVGAGARIGQGAMVSESDLGAGCRVGKGAFLSGVAVAAGASVPARQSVFAVPLTAKRGRGKARRYLLGAMDVTDDLRQSVDSPGCRFCGMALERWSQLVGGLPEDALKGVPEAERTLWRARLFPIVEGAPDAASVTWFADPAHADPEAVRAWREGERASMADALERADYAAAVEWREDRVERGLREVALGAEEALPAWLAARRLSRPEARVRFARLLEEDACATPDPLRSARRYAGAAQVLREVGGQGEEPERLMSRALGRVSDACALGAGGSDPAGWGMPGEACLVATPARVDLGGGWTDTPPQSLELGGTVVNMAITVEGRYPIVAYAEPLDVPEVSLRLLPSGATTAVGSSRELVSDLSDPYCLLRSVVRYCWPVAEGTDHLAEWLRASGRGFRLTVRSWLPQGSGLGTSSIMALAALHAVHGLFGSRPGKVEAFRAVLRIEQLMTAGGGWQDQAGAILPGLKRIDTEPGIVQSPRFSEFDRNEEFAEYLRGSTMLYFLGRRRTAMPILREIVQDYLSRRGDTAICLESLRTNAIELWDHLTAGRWDLLGPMANVYREVVAHMCPPAINAAMRAVLTQAAPYIRGAKMVGAGGGGFMFFHAHSPDHATKLAEVLRPFSWRGLGERYTYALAREACHTVPVTEESLRTHLGHVPQSAR